MTKILVELTGRQVLNMYDELNKEMAESGKLPQSIQVYINACKYPTKDGYYLVSHMGEEDEKVYKYVDKNELREIKLNRI